MGMIIGLIGLAGAFILSIVGGIVGWRTAKDSKWRFLAILFGILVGAGLGFVVGFGLGWLIFSKQM